MAENTKSIFPIFAVDVPMPIATTMEATPKSDARLRLEYNLKGEAAAKTGEHRHPPGDPTSMIGGWWFEGYDRTTHPSKDEFIEAVKEAADILTGERHAARVWRPGEGVTPFWIQERVKALTQDRGVNGAEIHMIMHYERSRSNWHGQDLHPAFEDYAAAYSAQDYVAQVWSVRVARELRERFPPRSSPHLPEGSTQWT